MLVHELAARSDRLAAAPDTAFTLTREGQIVWENQEIGRLAAGEDPLKPNFMLFSDEHLAAIDKENITTRIETWLAHHIEVRLKPLVEIAKAEEITGLARGIAFRLRENFGVLKRDTVADEIKSLDQDSRAQLRKYGVRFGAHHIYFPLLLKPAAADLLLLFWLLKHGSEHNLTPASISESPRQGLTSVPRNAAVPDEFYRAAGFGVTGPRAVRVDMLERLADIIRPLTAWKPTEANTEPPLGAAGGGAFKIRPEMMSIMGCSGEELGAILESLGFRREKRPARRPAPEAQDKQAPANDNVAQEAQLNGSQELPASQIAAEEHASEPAQAAPAEAAVTAEPVGEEHSEAAAPSIAEVEDGAAVEAETASEPSQVAPSAEIEQTAESASAADAEPEFEEVWRFRRPKPKFERPEGEERRHHRRPGGDRDREHGHRPHHDRSRQPGAGPAGVGQPQQAHGDQQKDQASPAHREHRHGQEHGHGRADHQDRHRHRQHDADRNRDRTRQPVPQAAANLTAKTETGEQKPVSSTQQHNRPPQHHRNERPHDRSRDTRPPHRPHGKQPIAASAAPKRAAGGVDPNSPFAALSQLKERLEKQLQTQD